MLYKKLLYSLLLTLLGVTGYVNAVITVDELKNLNVDEVGKEIEAFQRAFENDGDAKENVAVALDIEMAKHAAEIVKEPALIDKLVNDVCAATQDEDADCQGVTLKFVAECANIPYKCTLVGRAPVLEYGPNMIINSFNPIQLTAALLLYKQVIRAAGNVFKRKTGAWWNKFKGLFGKDDKGFVDLDEKIFVNLLMGKLETGVVIRGPAYGQNVVPNEYILGVGLESIISSYVLFYRMLTINVTNNFHTAMVLKNKLAYRIYVLYFKNMKNIGKALAAAAKTIFTGMDFMVISKVIREVHQALPIYLGKFSPEISEHQIKMMTKLFVGIVHNAAIQVADIDTSKIKLAPEVVRALTQICVTKKGAQIPIPKCYRTWGMPKKIKHAIDEYSYTLVKALAAGDKRARLPGRGFLRKGFKYFKNIFRKNEPVNFEEEGQE